MNSSQVLAVVDLLAAEGIVGWLDGGWGVDALLGEQRREHADLDLVVDAAALGRLLGALAGDGFAVLRDELPAAIALRHDDGQPLRVEGAAGDRATDVTGVDDVIADSGHGLAEVQRVLVDVETDIGGHRRQAAARLSNRMAASTSAGSRS